MRVSALWCVAVGLAFAASAWKGRAQPDGGTKPERIVALIRQLGHDEYAKREEASAALDAIGEPALDALRKAANTDDDPEIRSRAGQIVRAVTARLRAATTKKELERLQGRGRSWPTRRTAGRSRARTRAIASTSTGSAGPCASAGSCNKRARSN